MGFLAYPPKKHKTDSSTIFFIGSALKHCKINGKEITLFANGNFCPCLELAEGKNLFELELDNEVQNLEIEAVPKSAETNNHEFQTYKGRKIKENFTNICIDAGHGGSQNGTKSPKGIKEKDLNLGLAKNLKEKLLKKGFKVFLTRDTDIDLSLEARVNIAKEQKSDLFISLHHNAIPDHLDPIEHHGFSAHYYFEHSFSFAKELSSFMSTKLNMRNNSAIRQNLYLCRENNFCQSILIENGYLIHPLESEIITSKEFQDDFCQNMTEFISNCSKNSF